MIDTSIYEVRNARITKTALGLEDHGIMTFHITLDYGGMGQGFGGWALDGMVDGKRRTGWGGGVLMIRRLLETVDVPSWEKLPGTVCRVRSSHNRVRAISHYLKDNWFDLYEFVEENKP